LKTDPYNEIEVTHNPNSFSPLINYDTSYNDNCLKFYLIFYST
jgi:hypothetical protein